jgi:hypothetical protein
MESTISPSLRFRVFQATSKLYADSLVSQASYHLQWSLLDHFARLPFVVAIANKPHLALVEILVPIGMIYADRSDLKSAIRKTANFVIPTIFWAFISAALHRETSPLKVPLFVNSLNWLFSIPIVGLLYYALFYLLFTSPVGALLVTRKLGHARRFVRFVFWIGRTFWKALFFGVMEEILERRFGFMVLLILSIAWFIKWQFYLLCLWGLYVVSLALRGLCSSWSQLWDSLPNRWYWLAFALPALYRAFTTADWRRIPAKRKPQDAQPYQYEKLDRDDSIRLLLLYPRHPRGPVKCALFQTPLLTAPSYEAISYCWGLGGQSGVILVNGKTASVTPNALQVLKNYSSYWLPKLVWIDSLCVNQSDTEEKAKQMQIMDRIYKSAFHVSICLVQESQALSFKQYGLQNKYLSGYDGFRRWVDEEFTAWDDDLANHAVASFARDLLENFRISDLHVTDDGDAMYRRFARSSLTLCYESLHALFSNPWFNRIWVVQEVALARKIHVKYGEVDFDWSAIILAMNVVSKYPSLIELFGPRKDTMKKHETPMGIANMAVMEAVHSKIRNGEKISLACVLTWTRNFQSTDLRDRVFALRGICSDLPKSLMLPNYEARTSVEDVYINAAQAIVEAGDGARLLALSGIGYFDDSCSSLTLPSWVPNWTRMNFIPQLAFARPDIDYNAGGSQPLRNVLPWAKYNANNKPSRLNFDSAYSIFIDGYACSTIAELADLWIVPETAPRDLLEETARVKEHAKLLLSSYRLVMDSRHTKAAHVREGRLEASFTSRMRQVFWRTTMGNRTVDVNPAPAKLVKKFETYEKFAKDILDGTISPFLNPRGDASWADIETFAPMTEYVNITFPCWAHRRICVTSSGQVGMVPQYARVGDELVVFPGMQTPSVIRTMQKQILRKYQIVGECYIHGLMNEEIFLLRNSRKIYEII